MTKTILAAAVAAILAAAAFPQSKGDPSQVVDDLFAAMKEKSADKIRTVFTPTGQLVAIDKPRTGEGISTTRVFTAESFAKNISESKAGEFIEKMPNKEVKVSGDLAMVSGRYTFHVGDKFSHCGMNTFHLVRTDTGWKIANAASTLEFQCERDQRMVEIPVIEASPADVGTLDGIIKAFYATISGPKGQPRQWGRDRTLYIPSIRFVSIDGATGRIQVMTHQAYVNGSNDYFVANGFHEKEIGRVTQQFGNIAHILSTYESTTDDGKQKERGVNSIDLYFDGKRWWISAASWTGETSTNKIPKEFLKK